jgi:Ser/Thr protein kinase RdoA (MazF antagonist)
MESALKAGISHPKLYKSSQGFLYEISNNGKIDRLCVMEFIEGKIFYELQTTPNIEEMRFIIKQAALINKIDIKPTLVYDHWAITSLLDEYKEKNEYLNIEDKSLIKPLVEIYKSLSIEKLPHCFVHGDITKTNVMKGDKGDIFILDFAVANYYPRIQELAVILCDLFFDPKNPTDFPKNYDFAITEYQKYIELTKEELATLPIYVKLAHTMHILLANFEKVAMSNTSDENEYFLEMGRTGLSYLNKVWG